MLWGESGVFDVYTQHSRVTSCQTSEGVVWRWLEGQLLCCAASCCATACARCVCICVYLPLLPPSDGMPSVAAYGSSLNL